LKADNRQRTPGFFTLVQEIAYVIPGRATASRKLAKAMQTLPRDFAERGYNDQLCVDFSPVVVDLMSQRHADLEGVEWRLLNVCKMESIPTASIDVAFDKGTLDAMIHGSPWSPPPDVVEKTSAYIQEVCDDFPALPMPFRV